MPQPSTFAQRLAWVLYDCGNSGFGMVVSGVMFSTYFTGTLAPLHLVDGVERRGLMFNGSMIPASGVFALMTAASALLIVLTAPLLGAIADVKGWSRRLLIIYATSGSLVAMASALLGPGDWGWAIVIYVISAYFFGASLTFYNAYLPVLASPDRQGRLSGMGFAAGYVGGGIALIIAAFFVARHLGTPVGLAFGGVWWLLFSLPAFILLPRVPASDAPRRASSLLGEGVARLSHTLRHIRQFGMLFLFLLAYLTYQNGIDTIINVAPAYSEDRYSAQLREGQNEMIFLLVQFVAFPGALLCGYLADKLGNKPVIVATLLIWCVLVAVTPWVSSVAVFTVVASLLGLVLGGVQSSSRAFMARLAPKDALNEAFAFFSLSGKAVSIVGPLIYALLATMLGLRWSVLAVLPFLIVGLIVLLFVREPKVGETTRLSPAA